MSLNRHIDSARGYHERTAHSPQSVRASQHRLDWDIAPSPFKIYPDLAPFPLPRDLPPLGADTLEALSGGLAATATLDLEGLTGLLFFSAGITRRKAYRGGGETFFRAAPSTGALYQTEVYVVAGEVAGLPAGVHHFNPGDFALRRLREGDFRGTLAVAAADDEIGAAQATLVLSAIYWRNTWKYEARAYRHLFWDAGAMLANLLAAAKVLRVPARLVAGFVDSEVNGLLGLDPAKEAALLLVPVGGQGSPAPPPPVVTPLQHRVIPLSSREVDYPHLLEAYTASCLDSEAEVMEWRDSPAASGSHHAFGAAVVLPTPALTCGRALGDTIFARGSTRQFSGESITAGELSTALYHATRPILADVPAGLVDLYVNVHAVDGIAPGAYCYRRDGHLFELLKTGDFRADSAFLSLEQSLGGESSATVFFLSDVGALLGRFGNRGYRLANLEAGLGGGRLYLAAYGQRFGASGLTFYDGAVIAFFSPRAAGEDAIFVTALGRSVRGRARTRVAPPAPPGRD